MVPEKTHFPQWLVSHSLAEAVNGCQSSSLEPGTRRSWKAAGHLTHGSEWKPWKPSREQAQCTSWTGDGSQSHTKPVQTPDELRAWACLGGPAVPFRLSAGKAGE